MVRRVWGLSVIWCFFYSNSPCGGSPVFSANSVLFTPGFTLGRTLTESYSIITKQRRNLFIGSPRQAAPQKPNRSSKDIHAAECAEPTLIYSSSRVNKPKDIHHAFLHAPAHSRRKNKKAKKKKSHYFILRALQAIL